MAKSQFIVICILVFFSSCCKLNTEINYEYGDVTIKRIDKCGETFFYYIQKNGKKISGKIWVNYSGINDGFSGYLMFLANGKVELLSGDGYFKSENTDRTKFSYSQIIATERPKLGQGVYYISLSDKQEIEKNKESGSKVKETYKIDTNEWW